MHPFHSGVDMFVTTSAQVNPRFLILTHREMRNPEPGEIMPVKVF